MANKQEFTFDSRDGKTAIHAIRWEPDASVAPKAIIQVVHGMAEYVDRYDAFARYMTDKGFVVTGEDHLGHGKSVSDEVPLGYFCKEDPATVVVRDVHRLKKLTEERYAGVPYFILGHSMGSFIARDYLTRYGSGIKGAIIQGTGMQPAAMAKFGKALAGVQGALTGAKHQSEMLNTIAFGGYLKKISPLRTKMDWLSFNEENVDRYIADDLCGFTFTVNGFQTLLELVLRSGDVSRMEAIPKTLPILLAAGEEDPVGDMGEAVKKLYAIYQDTLKLQDVTMRLYPRMRHEILMEDNRQSVCEEYVQWIGEHLKDT